MTAGNSRARNCLVLGGTGAIGSSILQILQQENCNLSFTYFQSVGEAEKLANLLQIKAVYQLDFADAAQVGKCVDLAAEKLGGLDAVIQCIGISGDPAFYRDRTAGEAGTACSQEEFDHLQEVNARGSFMACQAALRHMRDGGGNIVVVGAMDGVKAVPSPPHFAMSKAALRGMVESMAKIGGPNDIKINLVAPGILETGASRIIGADLKQSYLRHCALARFGRADEVAEMAAWLALKNTYLTGQCLLLDGGL